MIFLWSLDMIDGIYINRTADTTVYSIDLDLGCKGSLAVFGEGEKNYRCLGPLAKLHWHHSRCNLAKKNGLDMFGVPCRDDVSSEAKERP